MRKPRSQSPPGSTPALAGFTLLEVMLAFLIFSVAVIALVEVIHQSGLASLEARRRQEVVSRLDALLLEITRNPPKELAGPLANPLEQKIRENGVDYRLIIQSLELRDADDNALNGLFSIKAIAAWSEGREAHEIDAETWFYPPLYVSGIPTG